MKKILLVAVFLFGIAASGAFGQSTEDEWFKKAGEYFNSGDYANAVTAYGETIKRNSSNLDAYLFRSFAYYQIKNYDAAIADCNAVIKGAPDFPNVYVVRGDAYGAKGIYHKAAADYQTGLAKGYDPGRFAVDKSSKADMWFCGAMYMEIAVNRFLGKSDVVTKYENWLKTACDKNSVSRAEVETFYRQNIGGLIAEVVDKYYGERGMYDITPSAVYAEWKRSGLSHGMDGLQIVKDKLAAFYLSPMPENFAALRGIFASCRETARKGDPLAYEAGNAFSHTLEELSKQLWGAVIDDTRTASAAIAAAGSAGRDLSIFSIRYTTGR
jgi:hypothetical protein